jgi:RNA polymerase sigma factor (sigma-70 family)
MNKGHSDAQKLEETFSEGDHFFENEEEEEEKYLERRGRLKPVALSLTNGKEEDADDLIHEAMYQGMRYTKNFQDVEDVIAYLIVIMNNILFNKKKQRENSFKRHSLDDPETGSDVENQLPYYPADQQSILEQKEYIESVIAISGELPATERELWKMWLLNKDFTEMSDTLSVSVAQVKVKLNALKAKLRYRLREAKDKGLL